MNARQYSPVMCVRMRRANSMTTTSSLGIFLIPLFAPINIGTLSSDAPNRGLFWDVIGLPYKLDFVPILDVHTGFPFSRLDQNWNYIGAENQGGAFSDIPRTRYQTSVSRRLQIPWSPNSVSCRSDLLQCDQPFQPSRCAGVLSLLQTMVRSITPSGGCSESMVTLISRFSREFLSGWPKRAGSDGNQFLASALVLHEDDAISVWVDDHKASVVFIHGQMRFTQC